MTYEGVQRAALSKGELRKAPIPVPFWFYPPDEIELKLTKRHEN